ncbi:hypothetical protein CRYUN_Cryun06bG0025400 [Craigia yunnanensis]
MVQRTQGRKANGLRNRPKHFIYELGPTRSELMPKKMGVNSKVEVARARKSATKAERKEREVLEKEETYWRKAEGSKSKAAKK